MRIAHLLLLLALAVVDKAHSNNECAALSRPACKKRANRKACRWYRGRCSTKPTRAPTTSFPTTAEFAACGYEKKAMRCRKLGGCSWLNDRRRKVKCVTTDSITQKPTSSPTSFSCANERNRGRCKKKANAGCRWFGSGKKGRCVLESSSPSAAPSSASPSAEPTTAAPSSPTPEGRKPHILFVLSDDHGWNDVGWHQNTVSAANPTGAQTTNVKIQTPELDRLASEGVKIESHYTQSVSSPSRSLIFTGRYPSHTGLGPQVIKPCRPYGLPVSESVLVESFANAGYSTHLVGKWPVHLGYCNKEYFPTRRGFDTWMGLVLGESDFFEKAKYVPVVDRTGLCWANTTKEDDWEEIVDIVVTNDDVRAAYAEDAEDPNLHYATFLYTREVERIVRNHVESEKTESLFMFVSHQAPHVGQDVTKKQPKARTNVNQPPRRDVDNVPTKYAGVPNTLSRRSNTRSLKSLTHREYFSYRTALNHTQDQMYDGLFLNKNKQGCYQGALNSMRCNYAKMVSALDDAVGELEAIYRRHGIWQDTILVFASDNGGYNQRAHGNSGSNYPLRGFKTSLFEGGIRTPAFIRGTESNLAPLPLGAESTALFSAADWLPSLAGLANVQLTSNKPLDGLDQSAMFRSGGEESVREMIVHNAHHNKNTGAIRLGDYKLLIVDDAMRIKKENSMQVDTRHRFGKSIKPHKERYLFNIAQDPTESKNLANARPDKVSELEDALFAYRNANGGVVADLHVEFGDATNDPRCISEELSALQTGWCEVV